MASITIQVCDFHTKSKSSGKLIDKQSVINVINSAKFKENLKSGRVLSLFTHKDRYNLDDQNIPFTDNVYVSPYLAGVGKKCWMDESRDALMAEIDLLDTTYGRLWQDLLKKGIMTETSMSVQAHVSPDGTRYIIDDILSFGDFTAHMDLAAGVVSTSFSVKSGKSKGVYNFSQVQTKETLITNFNINEPCKSDPKLLEKYIKIFSESTGVRPEITDIGSEKTEVVEVMPVRNTAVPQDESVITNLDVGGLASSIAGVDVEPITNSGTANKYPVFLKVSSGNCPVYKINSEQEYSTATRLFNDVGIIIELVNDEPLVENAIPFISNETLFSEPDATPELDTSNMEKIHEDIPIEDQLTEAELIRLPNQITSQVNASNADIRALKKLNSKYFMAFSFNGKKRRITAKKLDEIMTANYSAGSLVGREYGNSEKKFLVLSFSNNLYEVQFSTGQIYKVKSEKLLNIIQKKNYVNINNFTISSYLQELHLQPHQVLRRRINEVIQLCRGWTQDKITNNIESLKSYFDSYILTWITRVLNDPNNEFNIILGLRLQNYRVDNKKMRDLNRCIKRMRAQLNSTGFMNKQIQTELNTHFQAIENDIYEYINSEIAKNGRYFR